MPSHIESNHKVSRKMEAQARVILGKEGTGMPYKDPEKQREYQREWEKKNRRGTRHKVWTFIFYPESADEDWREIMDEMGLPICVSPLHDRDTWTKRDEKKNPKHKEGELKKPHWHGLVEYPNPTTYEQVVEDFAFIKSKSVKYAKNKAAMALYLCHLASPDKARYAVDEVQEFGGADYKDWMAEIENVHATMKEMRSWLKANVAIHKWELTEFLDWCDENNDTWSRAIDLKCMWPIGNYMDRMRSRSAADGRLAVPSGDKERFYLFDSDTGERMGVALPTLDEAQKLAARLRSRGKDVWVMGYETEAESMEDSAGGAS